MVCPQGELVKAFNLKGGSMRKTNSQSWTPVLDYYVLNFFIVRLQTDDVAIATVKNKQLQFSAM